MATYSQAAHAVRHVSYAAVILAVAFLCVSDPAQAVCTPNGTLTTNLNLCEAASGETGWASAINGNFTILDGLFNVSGSTEFGAISLGANITLLPGAFGMIKIGGSVTAPGAGNAKFEVVCGSNPGTARLVMYAGTSTASSTVVNNVGSGVTGC